MGKKWSNILIVEDESVVAWELQEIIEDFGYGVVDYATTVSMAKKIFYHYDIDLILMDINLNDTIDGIELYKSFQTTIPIIYLTAYKDDETITKAIKTNPIGYLTKPLKEEELKALLQLASIKQQNTILQPFCLSAKHKIYIDTHYYFDTQIDKLFFDNVHIHLSPKETQLLKLLLEFNNQLLFFETIENEIWTEGSPSKESLRILIHRLRAKLEYKFIETIHGEGIKLIKEI
jgi:DNA-binding response OmpR family regulator